VLSQIGSVTKTENIAPYGTPTANILVSSNAVTITVNGGTTSNNVVAWNANVVANNSVGIAFS
jgi:hypothetical protein